MEKKSVSLETDGLCLVGEVYLPETSARPQPAVCLCHGIPAVPHDPTDIGYPLLAERFCTAGFVSLIFNFRGTGGSQGNLDLDGWTRDVKTVVDFLLTLEVVDKSRLSLVGFSGGAAVSVYVAAHDPRISYVIACACPSVFSFLVDREQGSSLIQHFRSIGVIRDDGFPPSLDGWLEGFNLVSPIRWIDKISPRPLLLVHGEEDEVVPVEHAFKLYEQAKEPKEIAIIPGAGHRLRLEEKAVTAAMDWLRART